MDITVLNKFQIAAMKSLSDKFHVKSKWFRQTVAKRIFSPKLQIYLNNQSVSNDPVIDWDFNITELKYELTIHLTHYTVQLHTKHNGPKVKIIVTRIRGSGEVLTFKLKHWDEQYIPRKYQPVCRICELHINVHPSLSIDTMQNPQQRDYITDLEEENGYEVLTIKGRGHHKHHRKLIRNIGRLYRYGNDVSEILNYKFWSTPTQSFARLRIHFNTTVQTQSRITFHCIWKFRRDETVLRLVPRDVFNIISSMIAPLF